MIEKVICPGELGAGANSLAALAHAADASRSSMCQHAEGDQQRERQAECMEPVKPDWITRARF
jgi:hypothetical protein